MIRSLPKKIIVPAILISILAIIGVAVGVNKSGNSDAGQVEPTPKPEPVNIIPIEKRPYITLKPLIPRNILEFSIHNLPLTADKVEVTLEYDRNKGVLDAVLREFALSLPLSEEIFMGSKSAGGHTTYHDDVIGGTLHLEFEGDEPYALEVPWRYDDSLPKYSELSTSDGKFQVELEEAYRTKKVVIMQSPGLPLEIDGQVLSGPYLFRGESQLPSTAAYIKMRLSEESDQAKLYGFDGEAWRFIESSIEGKTISAKTIVYQTYVAVK